MRNHDDCFDRFVHWITKYRYMRWFAPVYARFKEMLLYSLFGLGTVIISIGSYSVFTEYLQINILQANAISWIGATLFAFYTNRRWVFTSHKKGAVAFFQQLGSFSFGRALTLLLEEWMLYYFVGVLEFSNMGVKYVAQVVVIATNYFISKVLVFRAAGRGGRGALLIRLHERMTNHSSTQEEKIELD
jgi:putative flippase GtrA